MSISSQESAQLLAFKVGYPRSVMLFLSSMTVLALWVPIIHSWLLLGWPIVLHGLFRHWPGSPGAFVGGVIGSNQRIRMRRGDGRWVSGKIVDQAILPAVVMLSMRSGWRSSGIVITATGCGQEVHRRLRRRLLR